MSGTKGGRISMQILFSSFGCQLASLCVFFKGREREKKKVSPCFFLLLLPE